MKKLTILDCTFRDGGYYCDWNFHPTLIKKYLETMEFARVDIVEIGWKFIFFLLKSNFYTKKKGRSLRPQGADDAP